MSDRFCCFVFVRAGPNCLTPPSAEVCFGDQLTLDRSPQQNQQCTGQWLCDRPAGSASGIKVCGPNTAFPNFTVSSSFRNENSCMYSPICCAHHCHSVKGRSSGKELEFIPELCGTGLLHPFFAESPHSRLSKRRFS